MVYMLLGTGFEETEAIAPLDLLRRAGVEIQTVGLNGKTIYGGHGIGVAADIEIDQLDLTDAESLIANGVSVVAEGANMPCTPEAIECFLSHGILFAPAKAANAGGVATSGLEMSQNSQRCSWTFEQVDTKLKQIMVNIFRSAYQASAECGAEGNLVVGANVAGFIKVAQAMLAEGIF